ncbi:LTR-retrotransposon skipper [Heterostelium album PN500]|uniref:RNA-directed DNA polymerase n=1 Tax=Heterostelium pallidum (strain ATCC 26659 / Pp 5 / PN500) TaxID=670386 RepID=D3AZ03_HETP5|nr:LTR-retrotransposon skipper [Heterostelium album PN500]EFA85613.1 LTR-retrotransposon skipper [Heterostelium album PN500]|eukprot:XP_020437720.1 LTR-retrotransposon skipper [Heterostelium album PN500]
MDINNNNNNNHGGEPHYVPGTPFRGINLLNSLQSVRDMPEFPAVPLALPTSTNANLPGVAITVENADFEIFHLVDNSIEPLINFINSDEKYRAMAAKYANMKNVPVKTAILYTCNKLVMMDTNTAFNQIMSTKVGKASIDSLPKFDFESSTADIESHLLLIESTIPLPNARAKVFFNTLNEKSRALTRNFHVAANASWNEYKSMMVKLFSREFPPEHYVGILAKLKFLPNRDDIVSFNLTFTKVVNKTRNIVNSQTAAAMYANALRNVRNLESIKNLPDLESRMLETAELVVKYGINGRRICTLQNIVDDEEKVSSKNHKGGFVEKRPHDFKKNLHKNKNNHHGAKPTCYVCGKVGHLAKDCYFKNKNKDATVNFINSTPAIQAVINDQKTVAVVDTGADISVISKDMAKRLNVSIQKCNPIKINNVSVNWQASACITLSANPEGVIISVKVNNDIHKLINLNKNSLNKNLIKIKLNELKNERKVQDKNINFLKNKINKINVKNRDQFNELDRLLKKQNLIQSEIKKIIDDVNKDNRVKNKNNTDFTPHYAWVNINEIYDDISKDVDTDNDKKMNESVTDNIDIENETKVVETLKRLFPNVFIPFDGLPPSRGKQFDMTIKLKTEEIPKSKLYPVPIAHLEELKKQINDRLNKGWIKRSRSPFGSPILFVSKPDGGWRLCVDYRELNKITVRDDYPLSRINELLNNTRLAYWLSKLDLLDGYHQIRINEGEQYKTAFKTTFGTFEYTVTPFGLAGAGANFQRLMDHIFQLEILNMKICVYLDDILIMTNSDSLDDHINDLIEIFKILQKHDFKVKLSKCKFARREIEFLGHVVGRGIKKLVEDVKYLVAPNYTIPFHLECDASKYGIGHALYQINKLDNITRDFISFGSRKLTISEINYTVLEKELLSIIHALKVNYYHLIGHEVIINTDHKNIKFLREQYAIGINSRINRWLQFIELFNPTLQYIKGETNVIADGLSRYTFDINNIKISYDNDLLENIKDSYKLEIKMIENDEIKLQSIYKSDKVTTLNDVKYFEGKIIIPMVKPLIDQILHLYHNSSTSAHINAFSMLEQISKKFIWDSMKSDIYKFYKRCDVCNKGSDYGDKRRGFLQPLPIMNDRFLALSCDFITNLNEVEDSNGRKFNQIWVIVDRFSKYTTLIPTHSTYTSLELARLFKSEFIKIHGVPLYISSDRDSKLTSRTWKEFAKLLNIKLNFTTADHQQANGQAEIVIRAIKNTLRKLLIEDKENGLNRNWYQHVDTIQFGLNNTKSTSTNYTPFLIAYGRNPSTVADLAIPLNREPSDTVNDNEIESLLNYTSTIIINVRNNLIKIRNKMLSNYNKNKKYNDFKIGDKVYVKEKRPSKKWNKLEAVYAGPYEIIDIDKQNLNITIRDYISGVSRIRTTSKTLHVKYFKHAPKDDVNEREYIPVEKLDSFLNNDELISDVKMSDISNEDEITDETMDQDDVVNHQDEINQDEDDISDLEDLNDLMTNISSIDSSLEPKGHFSDLQLSRILNPEKNTYLKVREILNNNKSSPNTFINLLRTLEEKESVIDYPHNKVTEESNLLINSIMKFAISPELFEMIQKRSFKIVSKRRLTSNTDYLVKISNTVGWVSRQILAKHASKQINDFNKKIDNLNPVANINSLLFRENNILNALETVTNPHHRNKLMSKYHKIKSNTAVFFLNTSF